MDSYSAFQNYSLSSITLKPGFESGGRQTIFSKIANQKQKQTKKLC